MEELKFAKLSEVAVVEEPTEESHVLIVEGGEVKKAPKTAVGGGADKRELMYEWNFTPEDGVTEIDENVDDDLTWLTVPSDETGFLVEVDLYCSSYNWEDDFFIIHDETAYLTMKSTNESECTCFVNGLCVQGDNGVSIVNYQVERCFYNGCCIGCIFELYACNVLRDNDGGCVAVETGGNIYVYADETAIKAIRIYKVTK